MQLALETSTNICSVALRSSEGKVWEKRTETRGTHSEKLFLFIDELLKTHDAVVGELDSVIVSEGPGSYTGLRISASAVKGLLFQSKVKLYAANTLAGFAYSAAKVNPEVTCIHSIIDARRVHVYHQAFEYSTGTITAKNEVRVTPIEEFEDMLKEGEAVIGTGLKRINQKKLDKAEIFDASHITARSLFKLYDEDKAREFIREEDPREFDPKYYTTGQV